MPRHWIRCLNHLVHTGLWLWLAAGSAHAAHVDTVPASIGILAFRGAEFATELWQPLTQYLEKTLPDHAFSIVPVTLDDIKTRVENKQLDFVLTNAASYSELEAAYGASRIATLRWRLGDKTYSQFGAAILTRRDNAAIQTFDDLRESHFMAVHPDAFGGWWMARWELQSKGVLPEHLGKLSFSGFPQDDVVYAVRERVADAGTVRSGVLEAMAAKGLIDLNEFRILNPQPRDEYPLLHSTRLYPEWALATLRHTHSDLAREVAVALLNAPDIPVKAVAGESVAWTVPLDYKPVLDMMRDLRVGPYQDMEPVAGGGQFLQRYGWWATLALMALLTLVAVGLFVAHLVRRLVEARRQADDHRRRLHALQQLTASSVLPWEEQLKQPIETGCNLLGLEFGVLCAVSSAGDSCSVVTAAGKYEPGLVGTSKVPLAGSITGAICKGARPVAVDNLAAEVWENFPASPCRTAAALIAAPFSVLGKVAGTLEFYQSEPRTRPFSAADEALVQLLAHWIGAAYERRLAAKAIAPVPPAKKEAGAPTAVSSKPAPTVP